MQVRQQLLPTAGCRRSKRLPGLQRNPTMPGSGRWTLGRSHQEAPSPGGCIQTGASLWVTRKKWREERARDESQGKRKEQGQEKCPRARGLGMDISEKWRLSVKQLLFLGVGLSPRHMRYLSQRAWGTKSRRDNKQQTQARTRPRTDGACCVPGPVIQAYPEPTQAFGLRKQLSSPNKQEMLYSGGKCE